MASSRDDFVIAIRSAFLKKSYQQKFSLLTLIFLSFIIIILGNFNFKAIQYVKIGIKEVVYRSSFIVSIPENYLKDLNSSSKLLFADVNSKDKLKAEVLKESKSILILIGPEGDFSEKERKEILKYKGVQPIKINENILRSETAVISALSILSYLIK